MTLKLTKDSDWVAITASGAANWISVAMSPDGQTVLAVMNGLGQIKISYDGGVTWATKTTGSGYWIGSSLLSRDCSTAYTMGNQAGTGAIGRSLDGGATWSIILSSATGGWYCCSCSVNGAILYAGKSLSGNQASVLYKSTDYGSTLVALTSAGTRVWRGLAVCQSNPDIVYASAGSSGVILKTTDGGATWNTILTGTDFWKVRCSLNGQVVLVTSSSKTYVSTDGGTTWTQFDYGSYGACLSPQGDTMLVANHISYDYGLTWDTLKANNASWEGVAANDDFSNVITGSNTANTYLYKFVPVEMPDSQFIPIITFY